MYPSQKSLCFTGYRPHKLPFGKNENHPTCVQLKKLLTREIILRISEGYTHFICGFGLGIDLMCAEIVVALKDIYPHITLESALPCETQADLWTKQDRERYFNLLSKCDKETMITTHYHASAMKFRNHYMVDQADLVIAVYDGKTGGTMQTVNYAKIKRKEIVIINPTTLVTSTI